MSAPPRPAPRAVARFNDVKRDEHGTPLGDSDPRDPTRAQPIDAAKLQPEPIEPGSPPGIAGMRPSSPAGPTDASHTVAKPGAGPASSEPTGTQPYLQPGREPGQRGGPALRGEGEAGPTARTQEEIEARRRRVPAPGSRGED